MHRVYYYYYCCCVVCIISQPGEITHRAHDLAIVNYSFSIPGIRIVSVLQTVETNNTRKKDNRSSFSSRLTRYAFL